MPSIPAYQPPPPFDPIQKLGDLAQLQNYRAQMEYRQAQAEKERREQQAQQQIDQFAQQYPNDPDGFAKAVSAVDPMFAQKFTEQLHAARRQGAEAHKSQIEAESLQLEAGLRTLSGVQDDADYQIVRAGIVARSPDLESLLPAQFDTEALKPVFSLGLSTKDWLSAEREAAQYVIDGKTQEGLARLFRSADNQQKWDIAIERAQAAGLGPLASRYGPQWTPDAQAAAALDERGPAKEQAADKAATVGSFEDYVLRYAGELGKTPEQLTTGEIEKARKRYQQADDRPPVVRVSVAGGGRGAGYAELGKGDQALVDTVVKNPKLYNTLTPTIIARIAPALDERGFRTFEKDTADMRNKAESRKLVSTSINAIEQISKRIITKIGPAQRAQAAVRGVEAVFGSDPDFRVYQDARMALAGNLAVAQQGSRPSDADIMAIWLPLVPDAYRDTRESAAQKWSLIKQMSNAPDAPKVEGGAPTKSNPFRKKQ